MYAQYEYVKQSEPMCHDVAVITATPHLCLQKGDLVRFPTRFASSTLSAKATKPHFWNARTSNKTGKVASRTRRSASAATTAATDVCTNHLTFVLTFSEQGRVQRSRLSQHRTSIIIQSPQKFYYNQHISNFRQFKHNDTFCLLRQVLIYYL